MAIPPPGLPGLVWRHLDGVECADPEACTSRLHHDLVVIGTHELAQRRDRRRPEPKLSPAERTELVRRYSEGESVAALATRFGISVVGVRRILEPR